MPTNNRLIRLAAQPAGAAVRRGFRTVDVDIECCSTREGSQRPQDDDQKSCSRSRRRESGRRDVAKLDRLHSTGDYEILRSRGEGGDGHAYVNAAGLHERHDQKLGHESIGIGEEI